MAEARTWSDEKMEVIISNLLRTGVMLSAAVVVVGGTIFLARHGTERPAYRFFHGEPADLRTVSGIFGQVFALRGRGIIQLGLLLLIATPVARVGFAAWGFAKERDWMYVGFTLIVLAVLLYSLFGPAPGAS